MYLFKIGFDQIIHVFLVGQEEFIPPRRHCTRQTGEYITYILLSGKLVIENDGQIITMLPGDVRTFRKGSFQRSIEPTYSSYLYIHFDSPQITLDHYTEQELEQFIINQKIRFLQSRIEGFDTYSYSQILLPETFRIDDHTVSRVEHEIINLAQSQKQLNYKAAASMRFMLLLDSLSQSYFDQLTFPQDSLRSNSHDVVLPLIKYLNNNFKLNISSQDLEKLFHINFDYANRIFKQATGTTIFAYKNQLRINRAKLLLFTTNKSIAQIAEESGFNDVFSFSHAFKKSTGMSPSNYARNCLTRGDL